MMTQAEQRAAAHRQLRDRGVSEERIAKLDAEAQAHARWQQKLAEGNPLSVHIDNLRAKGRSRGGSS